MDPEMIQDSAQVAANTAIELVSNWGLQVLGALAVLIIGRWFASLVRRRTGKALERANVDLSLRPFFQSTSYYLVLTITVIAVMNLFGIQTTSLIAVVGAAGLAIGLALRGTLSNFAAAVMERIVSSDERVVADPATTIAVAELGDSSVNLVVRPGCKGPDYWGLKFDLTRALKEGLEEAGCSIPYPQHDVHVDNVSSAA